MLQWISIPQNTWHQCIVGDENWVVISFHTAGVNELIEERPDDADENLVYQQTYTGKSKKNTARRMIRNI